MSGQPDANDGEDSASAGLGGRLRVLRRYRPAAAIILGSAVTVGVIAIAWGSGGGTGGGSLSVGRACLREQRVAGDQPAPSDGSRMAVDLLSRSSDDALLDERRIAGLGAEIDAVLTHVRADSPELERIHALPPFVPGEVVVGLEPALLDRVRELLDAEGDTVGFVTGNRAFDSLNRRLGLLAVHLPTSRETPLALLCFGEGLNVPAAARAYWGIKGVRYAEPTD